MKVIGLAIIVLGIAASQVATFVGGNNAPQALNAGTCPWDGSFWW